MMGIEEYNAMKALKEERVWLALSLYFGEIITLPQPVRSRFVVHVQLLPELPASCGIELDTSTSFHPK